MQFGMRQCVVAGLSALVSVSVSVSVSAAHSAERTDFPAKPIRWIVPFPPGGSNDILSRYVGAKLSDRLREQVVIDNRAGANGIIGADLAAHATPDGYTILMVSTSWVMNAAVRSSLPYDVEKSFDPIVTIGSSPNCIVVNPGAGFKNLRDLVERAKANPAKIFYASTGVGGFNHFGGELFKKVAGINMLMVPYRGGGPAMTDVMAGQVPVMFSSVTQVLPHVRNGKLNVLAVGSTKRSIALPDVPTVVESGYPGYDVAVWWGVVGPLGIPAALQQKLRAEFNAVLQDPDTIKRLTADSAEPMNLSPAEFRKMIHAEVKKWTGVARSAKISVQ
ncbi:MAG TPA: tripartite tricarboxylate transporter substrate binding protein [Burkholderiales bacterium]|nr:tripartite tricarboxylate transporter substrate binding protein [Burkholderiales bacterium]